MQESTGLVEHPMSITGVSLSWRVPRVDTLASATTEECGYFLSVLEEGAECYCR